MKERIRLLGGVNADKRPGRITQCPCCRSKHRTHTSPGRDLRPNGSFLDPISSQPSDLDPENEKNQGQEISPLPPLLLVRLRWAPSAFGLRVTTGLLRPRFRGASQ